MKEDQEPSGGALVSSASRALAHRSAALAKRGLESLSQLPWKLRSLFNGSSYHSSVSPFGEACTGRAVKVAHSKNAYYADHLFYEHVIEIANLDRTDSLTLSAPAAFPYVEQGKQWAVATAPTCFAWSPCGRYLVTGSDNHEVALRLFDLKERRFVECFGRHADSLFHLAWSASGEYLASSSEVRDPHLKLWRCTWSDDLFGRAIHRIELVAETVSLSGVPKHLFDEIDREWRGLYGFDALAFDPKSKLLAVVSQIRGANDGIVIFDLPTLGETDRIATNGRVNDLSWTADGRFLLFTCDEKLFKVAGTGSKLPLVTNLEFDLCACNPIRDVIALARGHFVQVADDQGHVDHKYEGGLISIRKLSDLSVISEYAAPSGITGLCWSSDGSQLYAISYDGLGLQYELRSRTRLADFSAKEQSRIIKGTKSLLSEPKNQKANELWLKEQEKTRKEEDDQRERFLTAQANDLDGSPSRKP